MVKYSDIISVLEEQEKFLEVQYSIPRELNSVLPHHDDKHALIISGIRRCGKSTLMKQRLSYDLKDSFFLNFDTPKLFGFEIRDFEILDEIIVASKKKSIFFDEIQVVEGWELYIRKKLDEGYRVSITGSNASLLSKELGTKLTGRHITKELFPFSYKEFVSFKNLSSNVDSFESYLTNGGFPDYLVSGNEDILAFLIDDILYRDIAVRYGIRDVNTLKSLLLYLSANFGNLTSANKLSKTFQHKSSNTIAEYLHYFEQSYLIQSISKFSYSLKVQAVNPKKIYFIDNALAKSLTIFHSENLGRLFENTIFWEIRRKHSQIYYFNENNHECDFIVFEKDQIKHIIQVCHTLNNENQDREIAGVVEAMKFFKITKGIIVTMSQTDKIIVNEGKIHVLPAFQFLEGEI